MHSLTTSNSLGANKGGKHKHLSPPSPLQLPPSGPSVRLHYPLQGHAVHYKLHYWHQHLDTEVWCIDEDYLHKRGDILITGLPLAKQFTHSPQRARNSVWPSPSYCSSETQVQIYKYIPCGCFFAICLLYNLESFASKSKNAMFVWCWHPRLDLPLEEVHL